MPVLGGLFGGRDELGPAVIPVPAEVAAAFRVYYTPGYPPLLPDDLRARALAFAAAHVEEPLRTALAPLIAAPELTYSDMPKTSFPPPPGLAAAGQEEQARLEAAWQVAVVSCPARLQVPVLGHWAALAAARSAALELGGALVDPAAGRLPPIAGYGEPIAGRGVLRAGGWTALNRETGVQGLARWHTTGLGRFGLPEVELAGGDPRLELGPLVLALAQHLLDQLLTANHGRAEPVAQLVLGPELELAVQGRPVRFRVHLDTAAGPRPAHLGVLPVAAFRGTQAEFLASLLA